MDQQSRYPDSNVVLYEPNYWALAEKEAHRLLDFLETDYTDTLSKEIASFLDLHQMAVNTPSMGVLRRNIYAMQNTGNIKKSIEDLMKYSRNTIIKIQDLDKQ